MEKIYKKICLERSRSRSQGLVPFIKLGDSGRTNVSDDTPDGNWGGFPYNPKELVEQDKTYMDVMYRYFEIWKQIRNGIIVKKLDITEECDCAPVGLSWTDKFVDKKNPVYLNVYDNRILAVNKEHFYFNDDTETYFLVDEEYTDANDSEYLILVDDVEWMHQCASYLDRDWKEYCKFVDKNYLGKVVIPEEKVMLGERVPRIMFYADIPQYIKWMRDTETSNDCCTKELWKARGGSEFTAYLESILSECESAFSKAEDLVEDESASTPTIDIMVSLTQNVADEGAFKNYDETWYADFTEEDPEDRDMLSWPYAMSSTRIKWCDELGGYINSACTAECFECSAVLESQIEVPSYLPDMMHTPFFYDDNRIMVNGQMRKFDRNDGFFECTYYVNESKEPSVSERVVITYEFENGTTSTTTIDKGCTQEEKSAWPQNPDTYQIVAPKLYNGRVESTTAETTGEYAVGQTYEGHTITESTTYLTKTYATYGWWEAVKLGLTEDFEICDGVNTKICKEKPGESKKYRMLTMLEAIDCLVPSDYNIDDVKIKNEDGTINLESGDKYYFLVIYDNGPTHPSGTTSCNAGSQTIPVGSYVSTDIPFDVGAPLNLTTILNKETGEPSGDFIGDCVLSATSGDGKITIEYVIGGIFNSNKEYQHDTGTLLEETHNYYPDKMFYHNIDGVSGVPVYCNYIDFESDKKTGVSSYNGLTGRYNTSVIKEMNTGDVWTSESGSIRSVIYKEDYLLGVSYEPETDINVSYDNGTVAAWEKHFKLGECNTFQDVENYGNNYFNLQ